MVYFAISLNIRFFHCTYANYSRKYGYNLMEISVESENDEKSICGKKSLPK